MHIVYTEELGRATETGAGASARDTPTFTALYPLATKCRPKSKTKNPPPNTTGDAREKKKPAGDARNSSESYKKPERKAHRSGSSYCYPTPTATMAVITKAHA